jgi:hypothetical protein
MEEETDQSKYNWKELGIIHNQVQDLYEQFTQITMKGFGRLEPSGIITPSYCSISDLIKDTPERTEALMKSYDNIRIVLLQELSKHRH